MKRLLFSLLLLVALPAFSQPTFNFDVATSRGVESVVPVLAWSTTPAATSCTATGPAAWAGTKAASGTQTLAAITADATFTLACTWPADTQMKFTWTPATTNTNGTSYTNPKDQIVKWRYKGATEMPLEAETACTPPVFCATVPPAATTHTASGLTAAGTVEGTVFARNTVDVMSTAAVPFATKAFTGLAQARTLTTSITVDARPAAPSNLMAE